MVGSLPRLCAVTIRRRMCRDRRLPTNLIISLSETRMATVVVIVLLLLLLLLINVEGISVAHCPPTN